MNPRPLPPQLRERAFRVGDALDAGVTPRRLRAQDLETPFYGVRRVREGRDRDGPSGLLTIDQRHDAVRRACLAMLPRMAPDHFLSGGTAAALWRLPLPAYLPVLPLEIAGITPHRAPRTPGVTASRLQVDPHRDLTHLAGLPLSRPAEAWAQLARSRLSIDELIIVADALIGRAGLASLDELHLAAHRVRRIGVGRLDAALEEARVGSESPRETETRLILVRGGLPEPVLNGELRDGDGILIARLDMAFPEYRVSVEYDGRYHSGILDSSHGTPIAGRRSRQPGG